MVRIKTIIKKIRYIFYCIRIRIGFLMDSNEELIENKGFLEKKWEKNDINCVLDQKRTSSKTKDLSIIVPLYNSEKYLDTLVSKVVHQVTNYSYELILVDDGSRDSTLEIAKEYAKEYPNIVNVIHQSNAGISSARNNGLNHSRGKYISFIDHDDYIDKNYVERLLSVAEEQGADIVKCGSGSIEDNKLVLKNAKNNKVIKGLMGNSIIEYKGYIWGGVYRYEIFERIQFPVGYWYEDMITRTLIYRQSELFVNVKDILHYRVLHEEQTSKKVWSNTNYKCLEHLYLLEILLKDNKKLNLKEDAYLFLSALVECSFIMVGRINGLDTETKKQVFIRACRIIDSLYKEEYMNLIPRKWKMFAKILLKKRYDLWVLEARMTL